MRLPCYLSYCSGCMTILVHIEMRCNEEVLHSFILIVTQSTLFLTARSFACLSSVVIQPHIAIQVFEVTLLVRFVATFMTRGFHDSHVHPKKTCLWVFLSVFRYHLLSFGTGAPLFLQVNRGNWFWMRVWAEDRNCMQVKVTLPKRWCRCHCYWGNFSCWRALL